MSICRAKGHACFQHRLLECIDKGLNDEAQLLLQKIENPCDLVDSQRKSLLHYSTQYGNARMMQYMIEKGCKVNAQDNRGVTPLMTAVETANVPITEILLKNNADIYVTNRVGECALQRSFYMNFDGYEDRKFVFKRLLGKINNDYLRDKQETIKTVLNACSTVKLIVVATCNIELTSLVLQNDYPIDYCEPKYSLTALHCAIILRKPVNAKYLIEHGANVDALNVVGHTPLRFYTECSFDSIDENSDVLKMFLKRSANLYVFDAAQQATDLQFLLGYGTKETIKTVLQSGIDVNPGIDNLPLQFVLMANDRLDVTDITELGIKIDVNLTDPQMHYSALMSAVQHGSVRNVEYLLEHGADVNYIIDEHRMTALSLAAEFCETNELKMTELLLQYGAQVQVTYSNGKTLLDYLLKNRNRETRPIQPIVAHLAMLAAIDKSAVSEATRNSINADTLFKSNFDLCSQQLDQLKNIVLDGTVTLFKLLHVKEEALVAYARNEELIKNYETSMGNIVGLDSYYLNTMQRRVTKAMKRVKVEEKLAQCIEILTGFGIDGHYIIVYKIVGYLDSLDFHNLRQV